MKIKIFFSLIATSLLIGCGGSSSSNEENTNNGVNKSYTLAVTATTATNLSGGECRNADGEFTINDHKMIGTVHDGWGKDYTINATEKDGVIEDGAFAFAAGGNAATFKGAVNINDLSGTWEDVGGCKGTWVGTAK